MRWGKLQGVQEQDVSNTQSSKKPIREIVTIDLLLLKGAHKNHLNTDAERRSFLRANLKILLYFYF